jgi:hypothetical protein
MTLLSQTLVLYLVVGVGVAGAVYLSAAETGRERWLRVLTAVPFWPLYVPILLSRRSGRAWVGDMPTQGRPLTRDDMTAAITQVDTELEAALGSLDGWASDVLAREKGRLHELRSAWISQAERVREMDRVLALPAYAVPSSGAMDARDPHEEARRQNIERLRRVRQRAYDDLMGMLAWVRELVSMIHLAKFTGAPASRAEELVAQIAAAVEGLSETIVQEADDSEPLKLT